MNYTSFINKWNGKYVDYDGMYNAQCTDLMRQYCKDVFNVNGYVAIPSRGYAKDIFKNFKDNQYFKKVLNGPLNTPKKGDIIFWGTYPTITGIAGHVAIVDSADLYSIIVFHQNYPTNSPCTFKKFGTSKIFHGYRGILGWLTPVNK